VREQALLLVLAALVLAATAAAPARGAAEVADIAIVRPAAGEAIFGATEIEARVGGGGRIEKVEFYLDGVRVGVVEAPPFRVLADAGQENVPHHVEVVAYDAAGATATASLRTTAIQSDLVIDVALHKLYVTVERGKDRPLALAQRDFAIYDQGVLQKLVTFERGDVPFSATLLLDASTSMAGGRLDTALDGTRSFARGMHRGDEAKLLLFSDHVLLETPFTSVASILTLGLANVEPGGGTALNDALYLGLKRLEERKGRKVLVLLSDGIDVESVVAMEAVRALARTGEVALYWLRLPSDREDDARVRRTSTWHDAADHERQLDLLRKTIAESGGRVETLAGIAQVEGAFTRLLKELREQYVLGYYPSTAKAAGTRHHVEVKVRGSSAGVRAHGGYIEK
jgi:Ca-activated chloride channel homolog